MFIEHATNEMQAHQQLMTKWRSALQTVTMFQLAANIHLLSAAAIIVEPPRVPEADCEIEGVDGLED